MITLQLHDSSLKGQPSRQQQKSTTNGCFLARARELSVGAEPAGIFVEVLLLLATWCEHVKRQMWCNWATEVA